MKKKMNLIVLMACIFAIVALMPKMAMAEEELPHHPTQDTAVIVVTAYEGRGLEDNLTSELKTAGYTVTSYEILPPNNACIVTFRTCLRAGVIVWIGHGYYGRLGDFKPLLRTPLLAYGEAWREDMEDEYRDDFASDRLIWHETGGYPEERIYTAYITPEFISHYYSENMSMTFPNSLWYLCTCYSLAGDSMAQAFQDSGGAAYMGWTDLLSISYGKSATKEIIHKLCTGNTVHEVWLEGYENPPEYVNCTLEYSGDGEFGILRPRLLIYVPSAIPDGVTVWVDDAAYRSPVNITVWMGNYTIAVPESFVKWIGGVGYVYTFSHWDDGPEDTSRTVCLFEDATYTARYTKSRYGWL